ncbi:MAG: hypothetical protein ACI8QY_000844 [bacterium]|jgi:hypothetical protein
MNDLMKRIALIAKQNNVIESSLSHIKSTVQKKKDWDAVKPKTLEEKRRFIQEVLKNK